MEKNAAGLKGKSEIRWFSRMHNATVYDYMFQAACEAVLHDNPAHAQHVNFLQFKAWQKLSQKD